MDHDYPQNFTQISPKVAEISPKVAQITSDLPPPIVVDVVLGH